MNDNRIGLGGGCHWCTEAVFQALRGVERVEQGFIRSEPPDDAFSEAVMVTFNPSAITLADLIEIHLRTHASTSQHKMRDKYRSAVYVFSPEQGRDTRTILSTMQREFPAPLVTRVLPFAGFRPSEERYWNYYRKHAGQLFCERHIDPKLHKLRREYSRFLHTDIQGSPDSR